MATRSVQPARPVTISRWRMNAVLLIALLLLARVALHLGYIQTGQVKVGERTLRDLAQAEINQRKPIPSNRGIVHDREGNILALNVDYRSLYVDPRMVNREAAPRIAVVLSGLLGMQSSDILNKLVDEQYHWLAIKRWIEPELADRVIEFMKQDPTLWNGMYFQYEPRRVYPGGAFAAHTIGAVNLEGVGISGVEGYYDGILRGSTGVLTAEVDAKQNPIWIAPQEIRPPSDGVDVELTLDPYIQHLVEQELKQAVDSHNADGGVIIVMDVRTGAIRAIASYPTFDPNRYNEYPPEAYNINPAISALYEPGSTFKIITVAAGMQSRAFTADTQVNDTGVIQRYGYMLGNWNRAGNGMLTPGRVLYYSSNVGALQLAELTGAEAFYDAVRRFGFGQPTGIDIAGEGSGLVPNMEAEGWSPLVLNTNSYGQGIAVTPLQMVRAVAAIGNDGMLMRPYIVQKRCRGDDCVITQPREAGQVVEPGVAWTVRRMLVESANHYSPVVWGPITGDYSDTWLVPGYEICAKTGTSSIPDGRGGYDTSGTIGSVVGLAPAEQARYAVLVKIDRPRDDIWGVSTAIPVYQAIAEQLMRYERIQPNPALAGYGQTAGLLAAASR
ncbi:MAG TPA: penicillin-binding protein 2 [Roseiflexaceae bacterium]|nr:penicillin-binding protein 2 [Roseiflexaceae bacterium]HMP40426.1 penicillin-binding protein 2 [Roseiflexaceae bacterium]